MATTYYKKLKRRIKRLSPEDKKTAISIWRHITRTCRYNWRPGYELSFDEGYRLKEKINSIMGTNNNTSHYCSDADDPTF